MFDHLEAEDCFKHFQLEENLWKYNKQEKSTICTSTSTAKPSNLQILLMYLMSRSGKTAAIKRMASAPFARALQICHASTTNSLHNRGHCIFCQCQMHNSYQSLNNSLQLSLQTKQQHNSRSRPLLQHSLSTSDFQSFPTLEIQSKYEVFLF